MSGIRYKAFPGLVVFGFLLSVPYQSNAQEDLDVFQKNWVHFDNAPNSLYHHFAGQAYDFLSQRKAKVNAMRDLSEWQSYQAETTRKLYAAIGDFPEKTDLNAKVLSVVEKEDYRIEHIIFDSQPGFTVTSSLFMPLGRKDSKLPVIIYCSGHAQEGYRSAVYQHVILNLVKKGFAIFAFDPVGQGERLEYYDADIGASGIGGPTKEHSYPGAQAFIAGSSQAKYMIWDGIRAVDYLLSRKEIDPERIGITGRSGGGTQASHIAALDPRIKATAPENYITNFTRLFETNGPQDAEQNFPGWISLGMDHADLILVRAPKPAMMITTTRDIFSIQGARETAEEVKGIYSAYGQEGNFSMVEDDAAHASTLRNREAMYAFFQKHLSNPGNGEDEETTLLTPEEIRVTPSGQLSTSIESATVHRLNATVAEGLVKKLVEKRNSNFSKEDILQSARQIAGYKDPVLEDHPVFMGRFQRDDYQIEKYYIRGEGEYFLPYLIFVPEDPNGKGLLFIDPKGKSNEAGTEGEIEGWVDQGFTVLAPDMLGTGEIGNEQFRGDSFFEGNSYNLWYASILLGRSILAVQASDAVKLTDQLSKHKGIEKLYGMAKQEMSPVLLFAAALEPRIEKIALDSPYSSYRSLVNNRFYNPAYIHSTVSGALMAFDLPDLAAALYPRELAIYAPVDGNGRFSREETEEDMEWIRWFYQRNDTEEAFRFVMDPNEQDKMSFFKDVLR